MAKKSKAKLVRDYPAKVSAGPRRTITIRRLFDRHTAAIVGLPESADPSEVERDIDAWTVDTLGRIDLKGDNEGGFIAIRGVATYNGSTLHEGVLRQVQAWVCEAVARVALGKGRESHPFKSDFGYCELEILYKSLNDVLTIGTADEGKLVSEGSLREQGQGDGIDQRLTAIAARIDRFREQVGEELAESLQDYLRSQVPGTDQAPHSHQDKAVICEMVNRHMDRLNLAIDYKGQPCHLGTQAGKEVPNGRFHLIPHGTSKPLLLRVHLADFLETLGTLRLTPRESVRVTPQQGTSEGTEQWQERARRTRDPMPGRGVR